MYENEVIVTPDVLSRLKSVEGDLVVVMADSTRSSVKKKAAYQGVIMDDDDNNDSEANMSDEDRYDFYDSQSKSRGKIVKNKRLSKISVGSFNI